MAGPKPIREDLDELLFRLIVPEIAAQHAELKKVTQAALTAAHRRYRECLQELRGRGAREEEFNELKKEYDDLVQHHKGEFVRKLSALLDGLLGEEA